MTSPNTLSRAATTRSAMISAACLVVLLAGCAGGGSDNREAQADSNACRGLVNTAYDRQNRPGFATPSQVDSPFATNGMPGVTTAGLATQFDYSQDLRSCVRGSAANVTGSNHVGEGEATPTITVVPSAR